MNLPEFETEVAKQYDGNVFDKSLNEYKNNFQHFDFLIQSLEVQSLSFKTTHFILIALESQIAHNFQNINFEFLGHKFKRLSYICKL